MAIINVQCKLDSAYYAKLTERASRNERTARGECTHIVKAVLDGKIPVEYTGEIMEGSDERM